ncbi:MAG: diaminopimelate epimerase [Acidimicrobiales bacterium]
MWFRLTKHHGLGNDFLVLLTDDAELHADREAWSERAVEWCNRPYGIGADGLLIGRYDHPDPEIDLLMTLVNADGSFAEMSGNGIRCLAQAEAMRRGTLDVFLAIGTDGGWRSVQVRPDPEGERHTVLASVDMGPVRPGPEPYGKLHVTDEMLDDFGGESGLGLDVIEADTFDVGNPHLVLLVPDADLVDVGRAGRLHQDLYPNGINVHYVSPSPDQDDTMVMYPWERGVGVTDACGTGATVVAHAAHRWGLVGDRVQVRMPGGTADVQVAATMTLNGPSTFVASVDIPR